MRADDITAWSEDDVQHMLARQFDAIAAGAQEAASAPRGDRAGQRMAPAHAPAQPRVDLAVAAGGCAVMLLLLLGAWPEPLLDLMAIAALWAAFAAAARAAGARRRPRPHDPA